VISSNGGHDGRYGSSCSIMMLIQKYEPVVEVMVSQVSTAVPMGSSSGSSTSSSTPY